ncbi:MAG: hypothetical protein WKG07_29520 [Hymenobacter sp.]
MESSPDEQEKAANASTSPHVSSRLAFTSEIDGYVWNTVHEPSGPSPEDREWAAASLNGEAWHDQDAEVPDDILDAQADEAAAMDRLERGFCDGEAPQDALPPRPDRMGQRAKRHIDV